MSEETSPKEEKSQLAELLADSAGQLEKFYQFQKAGILGNDRNFIIPLLETAFFSDLSLAEILSYDAASKLFGTQCERNVCFCFCEIAVRHGIEYLCGNENIGQNEQTKIGRLNASLPSGQWKQELIDKCNEFVEYCNANSPFFKLRKNSNISKHYDTDYIKVIEHLRYVNSNLNKERVEKYGRLLIEIKEIIGKYIEDNHISISVERPVTLYPVHLEGIILQPFNDYGQILEIICSDEQFLFDSDRLMECYNKIEGLCRQWDIDSPQGKLHLDSKIMQELFNPIVHIHYVRLCICYAIKAYKECSDNVMKQFNLYRIVMAYYEGYNKLYGISEKLEQTPLTTILHDYCENADNDIKLKEAEVQFALKHFLPSVRKYKKYRNITTHNNTGKMDILDKFKSIIQIDPIELFKDVNDFLNIFIPLHELTDKLASRYLPNYWT
jgi:hypothetical protein